MNKQKKLNSTLKVFYKKNPEIVKALELLEISGNLYQNKIKTQTKITTLNKTTHKTFYTT
ncbi:MAG: hypothetical protein UR34_C0022G0007 [candidate division WS6 bacterium GW2011_GWC1_33_20]|uniref:Uncharacterized protein n=2 Tax=Candidatus Dojkabacteria TaxID=74243 RepID=A0A0G0DI87_9BACT|nr:MAG: hypothetical protein UR34_C0022G0007 [candidate division WS6 bacterium GW2011_GWC1_33_20]KKP43298.1 MAG: hypothetical protein UR32_C0002G0028 [candidate division WS6 bacterium GW2011_GWE2_33_157]KKP45766.1 MAG: hypothetical protein UR36_C0004G0027 [candidate division WS6 bacterium GW2011_GWF1_33_233]KKP55072.1 MAG: hypothetical protein UR47_C0005G0001 [candidate division WS6 bacterium GW2011_GWB1_33_6]KKP55209.1 MAG: hypothetical protein UR45_C0003G0027 [candidate division WS6 bacterium